MRVFIESALTDAVRAISSLKEPAALDFIEEVSLLLSSTFVKGGKVLIAGNGGSLCDAVHFAEELTGIFRKERKALPAIALADPGHLTCIGNDLGFEAVFSRGVEALGKPGDVFIALTTSGNSPNILAAVKTAKDLGLKTVALLGKGGGKVRGCVDYELVIDGFKTSDRIQEAHMTVLHILVEMIEHALFHEGRVKEAVPCGSA